MESGELERVVARNVLAVLGRRGMLQRDLAEAAGLHPTAVSRRLRAAEGAGPRQSMRLATLARLAAALGVSAAELLTPPGG